MKKTFLICAIGLALAFWIVMTGRGSGSQTPPRADVGSQTHSDVQSPDGGVPSDVRHDQRTLNSPTESAVVDVTFPDGEVVEVQFRQSASSRFIDLPESLSEVLPQWQKLVDSGDGQIAHYIHQLLGDCQMSYPSERELDLALEQLYQTFSLPPPRKGGAAISISPEDDVVAFGNVMKQVQARCDGVTEDQIANRVVWLDKAIDLGYVPALRERASAVGLSAESHSIFDRLWRQGDINAAMQLGRSHLMGAGGQDADVVTGFAYMLLSASLTEASFAASDWGDHPKARAWVSESQRIVDDSMHLLTEAEIEEAHSLTSKLLRENSACCIGFPPRSRVAFPE